MYGIVRRTLSLAVLATGLLCCWPPADSGPTPTFETEPGAIDVAVTESTATLAPTATPAPTRTSTLEPTPTPVPTPTPTAGEMLKELPASVEANLAAMSTAQFGMIDETEPGAPFFGKTFKSLEGEVRSPDSFRMQVKVVAPGLGFVETGMMAVGEEAFMQFSEDAPGTPLPLAQVPFNFGEIGLTLSQLLPAMDNVSVTGREAVGDVETISIEGDIAS